MSFFYGGKIKHIEMLCMSLDVDLVFVPYENIILLFLICKKKLHPDSPPFAHNQFENFDSRKILLFCTRLSRKFYAQHRWRIFRSYIFFCIALYLFSSLLTKSVRFLSFLEIVGSKLSESKLVLQKMVQFVRLRNLVQAQNI